MFEQMSCEPAKPPSLAAAFACAQHVVIGTLSFADAFDVLSFGNQETLGIKGRLMCSG